MTYQRTGKMNGESSQKGDSSPTLTGLPEHHQRGVEPGGVKIDGFQQVLDLLEVADAPFRNSLLRRLAQRDPELAQRLKSRMDPWV